MKNFLYQYSLMVIVSLVFVSSSVAQIQGRVFSNRDNEPLSGISISLVLAQRHTVTNNRGDFSIQATILPDTIIVKGLGIVEAKYPIDNKDTTLDIHVDVKSMYIDEVFIETGYQSLPRERATGSFVQIPKSIIAQSVSSNIMERLEGVVNGLHFNKKNIGEKGNHYSAPLVRGVGTINSNNSPLVVVDNFPYEGDLSHINPQDIESITFLKDAAAASIWGARAGNGVIVIKTKKGSWSQPIQLGIVANGTLQTRPNLFYSPDFVPSIDFIKQELLWYSKGVYNISNSAVLSPVIEDKLKGILSDEEIINKYGNFDFRKDVQDYLYRPSFSKRFNVDISGGGEVHNFRLSSGLDNNVSNFVGNDIERLTISATNQFRIGTKFQADLNIAYVQQKDAENGLRINDIRPQGMYPYARLIDDEGQYLAVPKNYNMTYVEDAVNKGLLNWEYRPLEDLELSNKANKQTEIRINTGVSYQLLRGISLETRFQYNYKRDHRKELDVAESYKVRNLVNRFTQTDGRKPFPLGDILKQRNYSHQSYSGRGQVNYNYDVHPDHKVYALAGMEIRQVSIDAHTLELYGFNKNILTTTPRIDYITRFNTLPDGRAQIPVPTTSLEDKTDRYLSYFTNASYSFRNKYIWSVSARKDFSNLFGVKTNDRAIPLWSTGAAWNIDKESFFNIKNVEELKVRATYGFAGNIDRSTASFPLGRYRTDNQSGLPSIAIQSPGNPELRWEKIRTINLGLDFATWGRRLSGSIEYFNKFSTDLIGDKPLDPTTGFFNETNYSYRVNYADLRSYGYDVTIHTVNTKGAVKWETDLIFNYVNEKVTKFDFQNNSATLYISTYDRIPRLNYPVNGLYSYPWYGLNAVNGNPQVMLEGELSENYNSFLNTLSVDDLIYHGSQIPRFTGSLRNHIYYKDLTARFNLTWKADYFFRSNSVNYNNMLSNWSMHKDFLQRWQVPGDEYTTQVPSSPDGVVSDRDIIYLRSEILVERGDHIRLQDVQVNYNLHKLLKNAGIPIKAANAFIYARDIMILWRANKKQLDPDRPYAQTITPLSISLGFNFNF